MRRIAVAALLVAVTALAACSMSRNPAAGATVPPGTCSIPPATYADLAACPGAPTDQIELQVAKTYNGKTLARIAVASKDPQEILRAMGAWTAEWSRTADSFTVFAYGSAEDYTNGSDYNRGRIYWNNGGPITVDICTAWEPVDGAEVCTDERTYTVANR